jgi:hypothetical protein
MSAIKHRSTNTVWYIDLEKVRERVAEEKRVRSVTLNDIERESGVGSTIVSNFLHGAGLSMNGAISLIRWSGSGVDKFVVRRRNAPSHIETPAERELRTLLGFLKSNGHTVEVGESPVVAAIRALVAGVGND